MKIWIRTCIEDTESITVPDDATPDEIDEAVDEAMSYRFEISNYSWEIGE